MTNMTAPPDFDQTTLQTCLFLVNVAVDMGKQWILQGKPSRKNFQWTTPSQWPCGISTTPAMSDFELSHPVIWSKFTVFDVSRRIHIDVDEPFGILAQRKSDGSYYIAFRGTQTEADALIDATTCMHAFDSTHRPAVSYPGQVHEGFLLLFNGMSPDLDFALERVPDPSLLTFTGHSQGSAVATLAAVHARAKGKNILHYNSASPRVGDETFAQNYETLGIPSFRLVNTCDKVPKVPDWSCQGAPDHKAGPLYKHIGIEIPFTCDYGSEENDHNPCLSYAYAAFNPKSPCLPLSSRPSEPGNPRPA
ncbi:MAG TPA: lipase family protein [Thermoanaerobaculia bacterium]